MSELTDDRLLPSLRLRAGAAFDLPLDGLANEVRPLFLIGKKRIDPRQRPGGEAGGRLLVIDLDPAHGPFRA